jgi:hypothetical protein
MNINRGWLIESDFDYGGYRCIVVGQDLGFRCGYVGLPKGHKFYGSDYDKLELNVHSGITYSDGGTDSDYPVISDLWWLGFDCGHCCDGIDVQLVRQLAPKQFIQSRLYSIDQTLQVRTKEYVESQLRSMVEQIIALTNGGK